MEEQEKARLYDSLMGQYMHVENEISAVPKLSLEEQMKQIDITVKKLYSKENQMRVDDLRRQIVRIQSEAQNIQIGL